jgi:hypothetical protein
MRFGYYEHVKGYRVRDAEPSVPLVVGEACHAFFAETFRGFELGTPSFDAKVKAEEVFDAVIGETRPLFNDAEHLDSTLAVTYPVLTQWFNRQWKRLESGVEKTIAVEVDVELWLPSSCKYGPICFQGHPETFGATEYCVGPLSKEPHHSLCLRRVSGRIDRVVAYEDGLNLEAMQRVAIQDFKTTSSNDTAGVIMNAFRSDQHLLYVKAWNDAPMTNLDPIRPGVNELLYSAIRLSKALTALTFHDEPRLVNDDMVADAWERTMALRAYLTRVWNQTRFAFPENTAPYGPCNMFGHRCKFWDLCEAPGDFEQMVSEAGPYEVDETALLR